MEIMLEQEIYFIEETDSSFSRWAKIYFKNSGYGRMLFDKCVYELSSKNQYTLEDWKFLEKVSREIQRLEKEKYNKFKEWWEKNGN